MKWPPTLCWTAPKTINGNRHFQVKAYGGKNEDRWVDIFPTKNKKDIKRISWAKLKSEWTPAVSYTHLTLPTTHDV